MDNQKLDILNKLLPEEWKRKYWLSIIGSEEEILIDEKEKNMIISFMEQGKKFFTLGEYVIMINSIRMISPRYESNNIPPRPSNLWEYDNNANKINRAEEDQKKWDSFFSNREKLINKLEIRNKNKRISFE